MRLIRAGVRRLARRPATWITYLLLTGLNALILLAVVVAARQATDPQSALASRLILTFPGAWTLVLSMTVSVGGLLALTYGAAIAGSEWAWGTLKAAVMRGEGRAWYALTGVIATVGVAWAGTLIAYGVGMAGAILGAGAVGAPASPLIDGATAAELAGQLARAGLAIAMDVAIGFAIATVARSQLAGIGAGIALYIGEGIIGIFLPWLIKWAPFAAAGAMLAGGSGEAGITGGGARLDASVAIVVTTAWLVIAIGVAALWTERAEISG